MNHLIPDLENSVLFEVFWSPLCYLGRDTRVSTPSMYMPPDGQNWRASGTPPYSSTGRFAAKRYYSHQLPTFHFLFNNFDPFVSRTWNMVWQAMRIVAFKHLHLIASSNSTWPLWCRRSVRAFWRTTKAWDTCPVFGGHVTCGVILTMHYVLQVYWGKIEMIDAERRLLANALMDSNNQYFTLVSESYVLRP